MHGATSTLGERTPDEADTFGLRAVDCDIHPHFDCGIKSLSPYLDAAGRRRVLGAAYGQAWASAAYASQFTLPKNDMYINPAGVMRRDAFPPDGAAPASDPAFVASSCSTPAPVDRAVLLGRRACSASARCPTRTSRRPSPPPTTTGSPSVWLAPTRASAAPSSSPRRTPQLAAAEIEPQADRAGFVQVLLPLTNILMGERHYYPIYEAAARARPARHGPPELRRGHLPNAPRLAGGAPTYYVEWHTA